MTASAPDDTVLERARGRRALYRTIPAYQAIRDREDVTDPADLALIAALSRKGRL